MRNKLGIIGCPLTHSFSDKIHSMFINKFNLKLSYKKWPLNSKNLELFIKNIYKKNSSILGFNVTIPYKEKIIPFLDELTEKSSIIGSVNTVKFYKNKLIGENTDGEGFVKSLINRNIDLKNKKALIIGTGGASKGIGITLSFKGLSQIDLLGRNQIKGRLLRERIKKNKNCCSTFYNLKEISLLCFDSYDFIIQTTPLGMKNYEKFFLFPFNKIEKKHIVIDIVYNPIITEFLKKSKQRGAKIITGENMLIEQAILSFKFWTNKKPYKNKFNFSKILGDIL